MSRPYVELRTHSEFSVKYAAGRLSDVVARAKEHGMPAVCMTERDSMRGIHDLYKLSKAAGVRPIYGVELPVVDNHRNRSLSQEEIDAVLIANTKKDGKRALNREERARGIDRSPTVCFRAETDQGLLNLFQLSSLGWIEGSYVKGKERRPRVDFDQIEQFSEGVSITIGGPEGLFGERLLRGEAKQAVAAITRLHETFGDRMALELHPHPGELHKKINNATLKTGLSLGIPVVAVNDTRYPTPDDEDAHTVTLCLRSGYNAKTFADDDHPRSQPGYHLRSGQEIFDAFRIHHPDIPASFVDFAIEQSLKIAERCQGKMQIDPLRGLLPKLELEGTPTEALRRLCVKGWEWREISARARRRGA